MNKKLIFILACCFSLTATAQEFTQADAQGIIETFFEGFHKGDTTLMKSVMLKDVDLNTAYTTPNGEKRLARGSVDRLLEGIANRPPEQVWKEEILSYEVQIDGDLAHVWTPYRFYVNGQFLHCGANSFTLVQTQNGWKIHHLIDSRRKGDCDTED
ncbi:nuclear transport factor 2 family protein [Gilvibacter sp.]|uniref:nuclear transport factor 2 family protein n=1 Tax=Gilvibacter sp. TaxID=2729997 RepID=UPI0025B89D8E|nr:nuclear transport factor 2 family protein [Gilvibacter sp.]NQX77139.1 nuclear transport factor 2 family protein [Gilvibacter sp.]